MQVVFTHACLTREALTTLLSLTGSPPFPCCAMLLLNAASPSLSPLLLLKQAPRCAAAPGVCVNCWAAVLLLSTKSPR